MSSITKICPSCNRRNTASTELNWCIYCGKDLRIIPPPQDIQTVSNELPPGQTKLFDTNVFVKRNYDI